MSELTDMQSRIERQGVALHKWANAQMPVWLRAKLDPADLVQQTFLEAIRAAQTLQGRPDHELLSFMRRILANNLIDAVRKFGKGRAEISPELFADSSRRMGDWLAAPDTSPSERFARNEHFESLAVCLASLPETQRIVVEMRYLQGAKLAEIALALDRSEGAVAALLHRAMTALRIDLNK